MQNDVTEMPAEGLLELPDCAPTKVLPSDLTDAIAGKEVPKYYASALFNIREDDPLPPEFFTTNSSTLPINLEFVQKIIGLLSENDACDKIGIKFIAKVYNAACSNEANEFIGNVCKDIKASKSAMAKFAIIYGNELKNKS